MTNSNVRRRTKTFSALTLAGKPRNQEASRKHLVRMLQYVEKESLRTARRARHCADVLGATDVEAIAKNKYTVGAALAGAAQLHNGHVTSALGRLLSIEVYSLSEDERYGALIDVICGFQRTSAGGIAPAKQRQGTKAPTFSAEAALAEATRIIVDASDEELDDVDWTCEPKNERERAIRKAIIAQVEVERMQLSGNGPLWVYWELCSLAESNQGLDAASDISAAIEHWRNRADEYWAEHGRKRNRRLLDQARRDVDGEQENG